MKNSKYMQVIKIKSGVYAVFNNLLMQPIYLNFKNLINLKLKKYNCFSKEELKHLKESGIVINSDAVDIEAV